jgi:hypothetical protein
VQGDDLQAEYPSFFVPELACLSLLLLRDESIKYGHLTGKRNDQSRVVTGYVFPAASWPGQGETFRGDISGIYTT